jgi:hypothetical protein
MDHPSATNGYSPYQTHLIAWHAQCIGWWERLQTTCLYIGQQHDASIKGERPMCDIHEETIRNGDHDSKSNTRRQFLKTSAVCAVAAGLVMNGANAA